MLKSSIVNLILKSLPSEETDFVKLERQKQRLLESDFLDYLIRLFKGKTHAFSILLDGAHDTISYEKYIEFLQDNFIHLPIYPRLQPFFMQIIEGETLDLMAEKKMKSDFKHEFSKQWELKPPTVLDHRVHNDLSAAERFFTYFAALLKMPAKLSNCTSICLSTALSGDDLQLYISCNLSNNIEKEMDELVKRIYVRLQVIEALVHELRTRTLSDDSIVAASTEGGHLLLRRLNYAEGSNGYLKNLMLANKVINTLCFDPKHEILTLAQKRAFEQMTAAILIVPNLIEARDAPRSDKLLIANLYLRQEPHSSLKIFPLKGVHPHLQKVSYIHAEQLLLHVLQKFSKMTDVVGISKLCCHTCEKVLREFNVKFYGSHQKPYPGVLNFNLGITQSPHPFSVLHLKSSPVISPLSREDDTAPVGGGAGAAAGGTEGPATALGRRLSFSTEPVAVGHGKRSPEISPLSGEDKDALVGAIEDCADGFKKRLSLEPQTSPTRESSVFFDWGSESPFHFVGSPVLRGFGSEETVLGAETEADDPTRLGTMKPG